MNVPVGPGGAPGRRRGDPSCSRVVVELVVYALVGVVVLANFLH